MAYKKSIYCEDPEELTKLLIEENQKSFCRYSSEADLVENATLDVASVQAHHDLLMKLRKIQPNLFFSRGCVKEAVEAMNEKLRFVTIEKHKDDYVSTMVKRIRNLCRIVTQGESKTKSMIVEKKPAWVRQLPWNLAESKTEAAEEISEAPISFGWDAAFVKAYRKSTEKNAREFSAF